MPKPSHLRSVNSTPAPAAQGAAARPSGVSVASEPPALRASAPAAQGAAARPSGVSVASAPPPSDPSAPAAQGVSPHPSGVSVETLPRSGKRRSFSPAERLRIVREAAACTKRGDIEALMRREGIYSSLLAAWRKQLALHGSEALANRKPGRKPKMDAKDRRIAELEKHAAKLEAKLALAGQLLALQKKAALILGIELASDEDP